MAYNKRFGLKVSAMFDWRRSNELTVVDTMLNHAASPAVNIPGQNC